MGKRKKIHNINRTAENDIRYRGPLSYRHLLVMGWLGIVFMVIGMWTNLGITLDPNSPQWIITLNSVCGLLGSFALPLLLLANYCIILDEKKTYKQLLIKNAALTMVIIAAYALVFGRYLSGIIDLFTKDTEKTNMIVAALVKEGTRTGDLTFNLFIDLFLCTLFMFFLNYVPKRGFFKNHVLAFRYLAVLPVAYEMGSLAIRVLSANGSITPSFFIYPFLTTKAPMSFVMFVALSLYIKFREHVFLKNGKTLSEYKAFLRTNTNSWQFSVFASIILVVTCLIDLLLLILFITSLSDFTISYVLPEGTVDESYLETENYLYPGLTETGKKETEDPYADSYALALLLDSALEQSAASYESEPGIESGYGEIMPSDYESALLLDEEAAKNESVVHKIVDEIVLDAGKMTFAWGFGKHIQLIVLLPFLLLLSYTRVYKNDKIDGLIPRAGVILAVLVSIECIYQGILMFLS